MENINKYILVYFVNHYWDNKVERISLLKTI